MPSSNSYYERVFHRKYMGKCIICSSKSCTEWGKPEHIDCDLIDLMENMAFFRGRKLGKDGNYKEFGNYKCSCCGTACYGFDSIYEDSNTPSGWVHHLIFGMPMN